MIYGAPQNWHKIVVKVDWVAGEGKRGKSFDSSTCLFLHSQTGLASLSTPAAAATSGVRTTLIAMIWMLIDLFILVPVNERRATIILCHIAAAKRLQVEQEKMKLMHTQQQSERKSNIIKSKMVIDVSTHNQRRARRTSTQIRSRVVQKVIKTCYMKIFIIAHANCSDLSPIQSQNAHSVCQPTRERWLDGINDANKTLKWLCSLFVSCPIHTRHRSSLSLAEFYGL